MSPSVRFQQGHAVWTRLTEEVRKGPAHIAVAWWGKGMTHVLPLRKGSVLVVRADRETMEQGQTSPDDLAELTRNGVEVHPLRDLHAKVFVFESTAFVGSMNVSHASWDGDLVEAAVEVAHPAAVTAARKQVETWAVAPPLTIQDIAELAKFYKPGGGRRRPGRRHSRTPGVLPLKLPVLRIVRTSPMGWEPHTQAAYDQKGPAVRKEAARDGEVLSPIEWAGKFKADEEALYLQLNEEGAKTMVSPPARFRLYSPTKVRKPERLLILSRPEGARRKALGLVLKALGVRSRAAGLLRGRGTVISDREAVRAVLALWRQK